MSTSHSDTSYSLTRKLAVITVLFYTFSSSLFFTTVTSASVFEVPKWSLTILTAFVLLILYAVHIWVERSLSLPSKKTFLFLVFFLISILASIFFGSGNKIAPFVGKGGLLISLLVIMFLGISFVRPKTRHILYSMLASGFFLAWVQILSFFGLLAKVFPSEIFNTKAFTPLGSQTALATFFILTIPMSILVALKNKDIVQKILLFVLSGVQIIALLFAASQLLPGQASNPKFLPYASGWSIAVDQLKEMNTAFFGVGTDNFAVAFTQFRPIRLNESEDWFIRFGSSSNEFFTIFTTMGILGLVAFLLLTGKIVKDALTVKHSSPFVTAASVGFIINIILLFLIPANFSSFLMFFILGTTIVTVADKDSLSLKHDRVTMPLALVVVLLPLVGMFFLIRVVRAEMAFGQSIIFANENKGTETYNAQIRAITANPYVYRYRIAYSNTNLALANSLASQENLSDEDRQKVTQLVAQSIREGKNAVALQPKNSSSWLNLASIYRQLINFAQGSDQWAISAYVQAIRLDSTNPQLRIDFGGLLLSLQLYEDAITQYKQAIALKPDLANAYYNLSFAYRQNKQIPQAYAAMQNVMNLLKSDSADYDKALNELNQLRDLLPEDAKQASAAAKLRSSELTLPEPTPSPIPGGEVTFNEQQKKELEPPVEGESQEKKEESKINGQDNDDQVRGASASATPKP